MANPDEKSDEKPSTPESTGGEMHPTEKPAGRRMPAAGPHADPALTNPDATPGTGTLPPAGGDDDMTSNSG